jgi:hypothetical protein
MGHVVYEIVEHDGGWAYRVDGVYSETYTAREGAVAAAKRAAGEQRVGGDDEGILWEDADGHWHAEVSDGHDRPDTEVKG